jgi:hypothetical protein
MMGTDSLKRHITGAVRLVLARNLWPNLFNSREKSYAIAGPFDLALWLAHSITDNNIIQTLKLHSINRCRDYPMKITNDGREVPDIWETHGDIVTLAEYGVYSMRKKLNYILKCLEIARKNDRKVEEIWEKIESILESSEQTPYFTELTQLEIAVTAYFLKAVSNGLEF